jgi:hypothetical protein
MAEFVQYLVNSGTVPEKEQPKLAAVIRRIQRMKDSWLVDTLLILIMIVIPLLGVNIMPGKSATIKGVTELAGGHLAMPSVFYLGYCLPLFRFLLARWLWHLGLWIYFLFSVQKLKLRLSPTHSDGAGGLGYVEVVQEHFTPLAFAFTALLSATMAEEIIAGSQPFQTLYYLAPLIIILNLVLFVGPLFLFSKRLWMCRIQGLNEYMVMTSHYVDAFDKTWLRDKLVTGQSQLGTSDIQSLADLTNSVRVIRDMKTVPVSKRLIVSFAVSVILPLLPFVFLKFNIDELMLMLLKMLTGQ